MRFDVPFAHVDQRDRLALLRLLRRLLLRTGGAVPVDKTEHRFVGALRVAMNAVALRLRRRGWRLLRTGESGLPDLPSVAQSKQGADMAITPARAFRDTNRAAR